MSTSTKLEYLNTTKQQIKSALRTQSNVFRDYVPLIQKYINNNPTSTVTNGIATNALDVPVLNYKIKGNSTQGENPSPTNLQEIKSVGDLVTEGEHAGKYKVPVKITSQETEETATTDIYLDRPLYKTSEGIVADEIDFVTNKRKNKVGVYQFTGNETFNRSGITTEISFGVNTPSIVPAPKLDSLSGGFANFGRVTNSRIEAPVNAFMYNANVNHFVKIQKSSIPNWNESLTDAEKVNLLKAYLRSLYNNGTPFEIVYELATPTEEAIDLPQLNFFEGTNVVEIGTEVSATTEINYITKAN